MTPREEGFLLLTSHFGNPDRKPLTVAQLRNLSFRVRAMTVSAPDRQITAEDLIGIGYSRERALHILCLLEERDLLEYYLSRGKRAGCVPITRVSSHYPRVVRKRLGDDAPGCLWAKGDVSLLNGNMISIVGSRELLEANRAFAYEAGRQAAFQGYTLVSGNARGADQAAQNACRKAGGKVISVVADALEAHLEKANVLYLSEDGFDLPFSAQRALSRNRVIHTLGSAVLVAQATFEKGGTWDGTVKNLRCGWSPVACFADGSRSYLELTQMGARSVRKEDLTDLAAFTQTDPNFLDT